MRTEKYNLGGTIRRYAGYSAQKFLVYNSDKLKKENKKDIAVSVKPLLCRLNLRQNNLKVRVTSIKDERHTRKGEKEQRNSESTFVTFVEQKKSESENRWLLGDVLCHLNCNLNTEYSYLHLMCSSTVHKCLVCFGCGLTHF